MSPEQLDTQSPVKIDRWIDIDSKECKMIDEFHSFFKETLTWAFNSNLMFLDSLGRIWGNKPNSSQKFPIHFEHGKQLIGYRITKRASN